MHKTWECTYRLKGSYVNERWVSYIGSTDAPTQAGMQKWWKLFGNDYTVSEFEAHVLIPEAGKVYHDHIIRQGKEERTP